MTHSDIAYDYMYHNGKIPKAIRNENGNIICGEQDEEIHIITCNAAVDFDSECKNKKS